jgi:hypothetical protein
MLKRAHLQRQYLPYAVAANGLVDLSLDGIGSISTEADISGCISLRMTAIGLDQSGSATGDYGC